MCEKAFAVCAWFRWCHSAVRTPWEVTGPDGYFILLPWHPASDLWVFTGPAYCGHCQERGTAAVPSSQRERLTSFPIKEAHSPTAVGGREGERGVRMFQERADGWLLALTDIHTYFHQWMSCKHIFLMPSPCHYDWPNKWLSSGLWIRKWHGTNRDSLCQITAIVSLIDSLSINEREFELKWPRRTGSWIGIWIGLRGREHFWTAIQ